MKYLRICFAFGILLAFCIATKVVFAQAVKAQTTAEAPSNQAAADAPSDKGGDGGRISNLIIGMFGAALGVLLTTFSNWYMESYRRKSDQLVTELRELYGPLQFFVTSSKRIYEHAHQIQQAAAKEFSGPDASPSRTEKIEATIAVNNELFEVANENNTRMLEILTNHYDLIEPEDAEIFGQFLTDCYRRKAEVGPDGWKLPMDLQCHLPLIYSLHPEFASLVNRRFDEKQRELRRLGQWYPWGRSYGTEPIKPLPKDGPQ